MVNNPTFSDITITFKNDCTTLFAHKMVLSARSKVLNRMFTGPLAVKNNRIQVEECNAVDFLEIMRFCYTDKIELNKNNFFDIMAAAHYYDISDLEEYCCNFAINRLTVENVCEIYGASYPFLNKLTVKCLKMFDDHMSSIVYQRNFMHLSRPCLQTLLARDSIGINEFDLFLVVRKWATTNGAAKDILKMIRYPIMTQIEFEQCCTFDDRILTAENILDIKRYIEIGVKTSSLTFSTRKREIYIEADLEFEPDVGFPFTWVDMEDNHRHIYFTVTRQLKITDFEFVEHEFSNNNFMFGLINFGLKLTDAATNSLCEYKSSTLFLNCVEPILLVPIL